MKYLVTGGAGFIGSHLSEYLLRRGHQVTAIDDLSTGCRANVECLERDPKFSLIIDTVHNFSLVNHLARRVDGIFHLAASVGVEHTVSSPLGTMENNIIGTRIVLRAAAENDCQVLLTSSSEVYGMSSDAPHREESDLVLGSPQWSRWAYAASKACEEYLAMSFQQEHRLSVVIARLFNVIGPRQSADHGMVLPRFAAQAVAGTPITVYGTGQQKRCFLDVRDAVAALSKLQQSTDCLGEIVNVGGERESTILELAHLVRRLAGSNSEITHVDPAALPRRGYVDVLRRVPSLAKIRGLVGFDIRHSYEESVETVVHHVRSNMPDRPRGLSVSVA